MPVPHTVGTDSRAPPETSGYALNHFALIVTDMPAIRHFYGDVLGLRHIVTHEVSPTYHVTYMGYPTNEPGFQTGEEMLKNLRFREGLLEFLHPIDRVGKSSEFRAKNDGVKLRGYSHLGIVVPDVKAAERRMQEMGVPILKALGVSAIEPGSSVAEWWGLEEAHAIEAKPGIRAMKFENILLVLDPEGNVVEVCERE